MKPKPCALVSDTDPAIQCLLRHLLAMNGYKIVRVENEHKLLIEAIVQYQPDVLLLDDLALCAHIRQQGFHLPIIVLSRAGDARSIVQALDQGADDYIVKPFGEDELLARLRAHLRHAHRYTIRTKMDEQVQIDSEDRYIRMNVPKRQIFVGESEVHLTRTEFELLKQLMLHAEKVLTHRTLLQHIWGPEYGEEVEYIHVRVRHLRCKVEPDPSSPCYIMTEPGIGYVFRSPQKGDARDKVTEVQWGG